MNLGSRGCGEPRSCHGTPAWARAKLSLKIKIKIKIKIKKEEIRSTAFCRAGWKELKGAVAEFAQLLNQAGRELILL